MKILYFFKYQETPMFQWQVNHIVNELSTHDIEVEIFNPLEQPSVDLANELLLNKLRTERYDMFMTPHNEKDLYICTLHEIKNAGIPTLLICFDSLTIPHFHKKIAKEFDLVWLTSAETQYLFDKWGARSIFMPYAANPQLYNPQKQRINRALFVGTPYGSRCRMINNLINADVPVTLYGRTSQSSSRNAVPTSNRLSRYKNLGLSVVDMLKFPIGRRLAYASVKNKMLRQSVLNLESKNLINHPPVDVNTMMGLYDSYSLSMNSVTNRHTGVLTKPVFIVNLRCFEVPAAGGILFSLYSPEVNSYFEDGKEAVFYNSDEEMIDKAMFYLNPSRKKLRETIKMAARLKATSEHTWFKRFAKVFDILGLRY